ncbi:hypothetical protein PV325_012160 [Microctonus aethiopoides]|nr:hypothetical protein PV325_012160 [Microctonus aethiopoides]
MGPGAFLSHKMAAHAADMPLTHRQAHSQFVQTQGLLAAQQDSHQPLIFPRAKQAHQEQPINPYIDKTPGSSGATPTPPHMLQQSSFLTF